MKSTGTNVAHLRGLCEQRLANECHNTGRNNIDIKNVNRTIKQSRYISNYNKICVETVNEHAVLPMR